MPYASNPTVIDFTPYKTSTTQEYQLGTLFVDGEDCYRYAKVGASTITKGKLQTAPAPKPNHHNLTVTAAQAIGDKTVSVTLGATAAVADEYAEGYVEFNDVATGGFKMRVKTHPAANSAAGLTLTFFEPLPSALTTSSKATLVHNTYNGIIEGTVQTIRLAGVAQVTATTGLFLWVQTRGVSPLLADQAITVGALMSPSTSVSGAAIEVSATFATAEKTILIGDAFVAGVDTEKRPVRLTIE